MSWHLVESAHVSDRDLQILEDLIESLPVSSSLRAFLAYLDARLANGTDVILTTSERPSA